MSYYWDLSADDRNSEEGEESDEEDHDFFGSGSLKRPPKQLKTDQPNSTKAEANSHNASTPRNVSLPAELQRIIVHVDIDCFYCACEHIDQNLPKSRPIAIGQKHIIVTSNYAARKLGVKKLQLRDEALKACPSLLILEGSDLERYRRHSRKVYETFRACVQTTLPKKILLRGPKKLLLRGDNSNINETPLIKPAVRRGRGMDELQADLTCLLKHFWDDSVKNKLDISSIYIYGEQRETTTLVEDQTGAQAVVQPYNPSNDNLSPKNHHHESSFSQHEIVQQRLLWAATNLGRIIQQTLQQETGFTTTLGISTNPLLAKLASDLHKPFSVNVLYPWRANALLASMPLRKIPDCGHKTIRLLDPALERFHGSKVASKRDFWTCRELLTLPKSEVRRCLTNDDQCNMLWERCQGLDSTPIVDDQGGVQKTISVENSFRRGTVLTPDQVWQGLEELYVRLPRLLLDRKNYSPSPDKAFPTTLKLTARVVDPQLQASNKRKRRPFVTHSKQVPFPQGRELMLEKDATQQARMVQEAARPLVQTLVLQPAKASGYLNVTRLNIAVTNFQDVAVGQMKMDKKTLAHASTQYVAGSIAESFSMVSQLSQSVTHNQAKPKFSDDKGATTTSTPTSRDGDEARPQQSASMAIKKPQKEKNGPGASPPLEEESLPSGIDRATLAELPPDMVQEIIRDYNRVVCSNKSRSRIPPTKKATKPKATPRIDHFFKRR